MDGAIFTRKNVISFKHVMKIIDVNDKKPKIVLKNHCYIWKYEVMSYTP